MAPASLRSLSVLRAASILFADRRTAPLVGVLRGEGIGPEVTAAAVRVLDALAGTGGGRVELRFGPPIGDEALARHGASLSEPACAFVSEILGAGGAILCGPGEGRFVYDLRRRFDLYLKLSPLRVTPAFAALSRLETEVVSGADVLVVRDNAGGVYQGTWSEDVVDGVRRATHAFSYAETEVRRVVRAGTVLALFRRGRMAVVAKEGGVPTITALWRDIGAEEAARAGVAFELVNIDLAAYRLVQEPRSFDVLVCPNLAGDVLADVGAVLLGGRGLSFSGNFAPDGGGVFQTNHGAARDVAGTGRANPVGQILSLAMLLREGLGFERDAARLEDAVERTLASGARTPDLDGRAPALNLDGLVSRIEDALAE